MSGAFGFVLSVAALIQVEPPANTSLLAFRPLAFVGQEVSVVGSLIPCYQKRDRLCLMNTKIEAGGDIPLRVPESLVEQLDKAYLPKSDGFVTISGCEVRATGLFVEDPSEAGYFVLLVSKLEADSGVGK